MVQVEIVEWRMKFANADKFLEFLKKINILLTNTNNTDEDAKIITSCPITEQKYDGLTFDVDHELGIILRRDTYKNRDFAYPQFWIPFLAPYVQGSFTIQEEDEASSMWGAEFDGKGKYKYLEAIMQMEEVEL
jgi:hypothetical protein